jgi:hypothetical protein
MKTGQYQGKQAARPDLPARKIKAHNRFAAGRFT